MIVYSFQVTDATRRYCDEIVWCLVEFAGKDEHTVIRLVNQLWGTDPFDDQDDRLHESPYYWAMAIAHHPTLGDNQPEWWRDPELARPPAQFIAHWYGLEEQ